MAEIHLIGRAASPGLAIGPVTMLTAAVPRRMPSLTVTTDGDWLDRTTKALDYADHMLGLPTERS